MQCKFTLGEVEEISKHTDALEAARLALFKALEKARDRLQAAYDNDEDDEWRDSQEGHDFDTALDTLDDALTAIDDGAIDLELAEFIP